MYIRRKYFRMKIKLFLFTLLMVAKLVAQESIARIEIENTYEASFTHSIGEKGVLLEAIGKDSKDGKINLKFQMFSTDLKPIYTDSIQIPKRTNKVGTYIDTDKGVMHTLYRGKRDYFAIISHNTNNKTTKIVEGKYDDDASLYNMKVVNNKAIFSAEEGKESKIIIIDLMTGNVVDVPFKIDQFRRKDISIEEHQVFDDEILVFINAQVNKKTKNLYLAKVNFQGVQEDFYPLAENREEKFISISATKSNGKYIITGTYAKGKSELSQGIYFGQIENRSISKLTFYNFLDLNNFTNFMSEKERRKIERKKENSEGRGYELLMNYNMVMHPIKETKDGYELLGEAYYPVYYSCGRGCRTFYGYQYTHALIAKFDKMGSIIWNNTFEIKPDSWDLPRYRMKYVRSNGGKNTINTITVYEKSIEKHAFDATNGKQISSNKVDIAKQYDNDKVKNSFSNTHYWYDQYYLVFGTQTVINKEVKRPRKIIFINKIQVK